MGGTMPSVSSGYAFHKPSLIYVYPPVDTLLILLRVLIIRKPGTLLFQTCQEKIWHTCPRGGHSRRRRAYEICLTADKEPLKKKITVSVCATEEPAKASAATAAVAVADSSGDEGGEGDNQLELQIALPYYRHDIITRCMTCSCYHLPWCGENVIHTLTI